MIALGVETKYAEYGRTRPRWRQVAYVCVFVASLIGFVTAHAHTMDRFPQVPFWLMLIGALIGTAVIAAVPIAMRRRAKRLAPH